MRKQIDVKRSKPWLMAFKHEGKMRILIFGHFANAEEAAWEHDLREDSTWDTRGIEPPQLSEHGPTRPVPG